VTANETCHLVLQTAVDNNLYSRRYALANITRARPLANFVVDVDTVCLFKARLDKFCMDAPRCYIFCGRPDRNRRQIST